MIDIKDTITSGQCFRFTQNQDCFTVLAGVGKNVRQLTISQKDLSGLEDPFWNNYFDMQTDYETMKKSFEKISPIMKKACDYAPGIRILNQDPWEALCSFVVSQNNNIKRIMGIVDRMCSVFGEKNNQGLCGFPKAEVLAAASEQELRAIGLGFRAPYIINTAKAVSEGKIDLERLKTCDIEEAEKTLLSIKGIGPKVASCALLFGCHRLDCFPIDTWMRKVMDTYFPGQTSQVFGPYAGLAQQYLFHWARTGEELK